MGHLNQRFAPAIPSTELNDSSCPSITLANLVTANLHPQLPHQGPVQPYSIGGQEGAWAQRRHWQGPMKGNLVHILALHSSTAE